MKSNPVSLNNIKEIVSTKDEDVILVAWYDSGSGKYGWRKMQWQNVGSFTITKPDVTQFSYTYAELSLGIDDIPVDGQVAEPISSNWAYDHANEQEAHWTAEQIQDEIGGILDDGTEGNVVFTYDDSAAKIYANVQSETVRDEIGGMLSDTNTIDFTYDDALSGSGSSMSVGSIEADVIYQNTNSVNLSEDASGLMADVNIQNSGTVNLSIDASGVKAELSHLGIENLSDPNDNRFPYWNDLSGEMQWANITWNGSELNIAGGTLKISGNYQFPTSDGSDKQFLTTDGGGSLSFTYGVIDEDDFTSNSATHVPTQQSTKAYIATQVTGGSPLDRVISMQTDDTTNPGGSTSTSTVDAVEQGDRYIILDSSNLHPNFGTITGVEDNDIVEYNGSEFVVVFDASTASAGAVVVVGLDRLGNIDHEWAYNTVDDEWVERGAITDHGALGGLGDDDHSQYLLLGGRSGQTIQDSIRINQTLTLGSGIASDVSLHFDDGSNRILKWDDGNARFDFNQSINTQSQVLEQGSRVWSVNNKFTAGTLLSWSSSTLNVDDDLSNYDNTTSGFYNSDSDIAKTAITQYNYTYNDLNLSIHDTPADGVLTIPITSNWAHDHTADSSAHHSKYTDSEAVSAIKADADWNATNWDAAYGWGDHSTQGYITSSYSHFSNYNNPHQTGLSNLDDYTTTNQLTMKGVIPNNHSVDESDFSLLTPTDFPDGISMGLLSNESNWAYGWGTFLSIDGGSTSRSHILQFDLRSNSMHLNSWNDNTSSWNGWEKIALQSWSTLQNVTSQGNSTTESVDFGTSVKANYGDNTHYGWFGVYRDDGTRGAYFGYGDGGSNVNLYLDNASLLKINSGNVNITDGVLQVEGTGESTFAGDVRINDIEIQENAVIKSWRSDGNFYFDSENANGVSRFRNTSDVTQVEIDHGTGNIDATNFYSSVSSSTWGFRVRHNSQSSGIYVDSGDDSRLYLRKSNGTLSTLLRSNGDSYFLNSLGIGTTSPASPLHIRGEGEMLELESGTSGGAQYIRFSDPDGDKGYIGYGSTGNDGLLINQQSADFFRIIVNSNTVFNATSSGKVGVGTTSPSSLLDVAGNISADGNLQLNNKWRFVVSAENLVMQYYNGTSWVNKMTFEDDGKIVATNFKLTT